MNSRSTYKQGKSSPSVPLQRGKVRSWINLRPAFQKGKNLVLGFLLVLFSLSVKGQNYPVQSFVTITPPYSSYLPDYADPFNNQMKILLTLTDYAVPSYQVKLRFRIESLGGGYTITSANLVNLPAITLTPGVPVEVSGSTLAPYLSTSNLVFQGINVANYEATKILPEGPANVCVEIVDVSSANQAVLNAPTCGQYWFALYDPPLLNTPFCGNEIIPSDPQQIMFSWSPLHMSSPTGLATQYKFELFEIRPEGADPNQVVNSTLPIYSTITTNTYVNYGIIEPQLQLGMSYVWRIQAIDGTGRALFKQNGYSQVCTFTYGNIAASLLDGITLTLDATGTGQTVGSASWNGSSTFESYVLEVRKTGNPSYNWHPINATEAKSKIYMLEPETEYECRVKGLAGGAETDWSNTAIFTTLPERNYECGSTNLPGKPTNIKPLQTLMPGMKVQTGQFTMEVVLAEPAQSGQPGHFKGIGKIPITFLATANVEFEDILIDENLIHHQGRIDVMTEDLQDWINTYENLYVDGVIMNYTSNPADSTVIIYLDNGDSLSFDWPPPGQTTTLVDDSGQIYTIDEHGVITITTATTPDNDNLAATADHQVIFKEDETQNYGFDRLKYTGWTEHYPCIKLSDGSNYFVSYKSVRINHADKFYAVVRSNQNFEPYFKTGTGVVIPSEKVNDTLYRLTVDGFATAQKIYAFDDDSLKIGKINLSVYENKVNQVVVVPINGATVPSAQVLQDSINAVFNQASATFTVSIAPNFNVPFDVNNDGLDGASDSTMSLYSQEMKTIRTAYFDSTAKENKLYLFVVPQIAGDLKGYMVRGKILGFIEQGQGARTYSHELGHGAFGLEHTFPEIAQGQSNNILDYSAGIHLTHEQWYEIQHFSPSWSIFDDAEDGALLYANLQDFEPLKKNDTYTFFKVNGEFITIPGDAKSVLMSTMDRWANGEVEFSPIGALIGFTDATGKEYRSGNKGIFKEYDPITKTRSENGQPYPDNLTVSNAPTKGIVTFFNLVNGELVPVAFEVESPISQTDHHFTSSAYLDRFILFESNTSDRLLEFGSINDYVSKYANGSQVVELTNATISKKNSDIRIEYKKQESAVSYVPAVLSDLSISDIFFNREKVSVVDLLVYFRLINLRKDEINNFKACFESENQGEIKVHLDKLELELDEILNKNAYMNSGNLSTSWQEYSTEFKIATAEGLGRAIAVSSDPLKAANLQDKYEDWKDDDTKVNDFAEIINGLYPCALLNVTPQNRIDYLDYLSISDVSISAKEKLLENISEDDKPLVYNLLMDNNQEKLTGLVWRNEKNSVVVELLAALIVSYGQYDANTLLAEDKLINLTYSSHSYYAIDKTVKSYIEPSYVSGEFIFKICTETEVSHYEGTNTDSNCEGWIDQNFGVDRKKINCQPGDFILIKFLGYHPDYQELSGFISTNQNGEELYFVPAIYADMLFGEVYDEYVAEKNRQNLMILGFIVGIGEIGFALETANALRITLAAIDLGIVGSEAMLEAGLKNIILGMDGGQQFLDAWYGIVSIYALGRVGSVLVTPAKIKKVRDAIKNLRNKNSSISSQVDEFVDDVGKQMDELDGTVGTLETELSVYLKSKGYEIFDEVDGVVFIRDGQNRIGKILNKNLPDEIIWFQPKPGNTWQVHEENVTEYLRFKYGNKVYTQVKIRTYHKDGSTVEGYLDDLVETTDGDFIIVDAKHSQKAQIVDGKYPGYTSGQKQSYQWVTDGDAVKIEIIGDGALPDIVRGTDILPDLEGKIRIITNNGAGQLVESSVFRTTKP